MRSLMNGTLLDLKTDRNGLIKDNLRIGRYCPKTFATPKGRKQGQYTCNMPDILYTYSTPDILHT